jgi:hypothetical protein
MENSTIQFHRPIPILRMFNTEKARAFYVGYLGFDVKWERRFGDNFPLYMEMARSGCVIHRSEHFGDATPVSALRIAVSDAGAYHKELQAKQYKNCEPGYDPANWESCLRDPCGNRLIFFEPKA